MMVVGDLQEYELTTQANEAVIVTAVDKAFFARTTRAIVDDRLYHNAVSNRETFGDTFSHLFDRA